MKKILLIATGGTIACAQGENGLAPALEADEILSYLPPKMKNICAITPRSIMNIDSSNMNPDRMVKIAEAIYENYERFDGFIVTHGTDTMGYTSASLAYMLRNIEKPLVLTGSQTPIGSRHSDGRKNISDAILFSLENIAGVYVAFDGKIMNGTRAVKVRTKSINAFESPNSPYIARIKLGRIIYNEDLKTHSPIDPAKPFQLKKRLRPEVFLLKIHPGTDPAIFDFIKENYRGVIVESFGIGGVPREPNDLASKIHELCEAGLAVVITTQCKEEGIDLSIYEVGTTLAKNKIISGGDMNSEAIVAKLWWALGNFDSVDEIKVFMETPFFDDRAA